MQIIHLSDIHLNHCPPNDDIGRKTRKSFEQTINNVISRGANHIILTGDISETPYLINDLYWLSEICHRNIYFVLGNHDYYFGSFELGVQCAEIAELVIKKKPDGNPKQNNLFYLPNKKPIDLGENTFLVGINGWYDLRNCSNQLNHFELYMDISDYYVNESLRKLVTNRESRENQIEEIQKIADNETSLLSSKLDDCLKLNPEKIIIATHVPPLPFGETNYSGFYSNKKLMDCLVDYSIGNPSIKFTCLCGHIHESGYRKIDNLTISCKRSKYKEPDVKMVEI